MNLEPLPSHRSSVGPLPARGPKTKIYEKILHKHRSMQHHPVSFPFDQDLIDFILTALCDIHSLQSFVLSSKFVYNVFNTRRTSILWAVVSNHLGPATQPALRLLKVMVNVNAYWHGWLSPLPVTKLCAEDDFQLYDPRVVVTVKEAHKLAANHDVVRELESLYSWR